MTEVETTPDKSHGETAARRLQLVRLVGSCLGLLVGVVFCHQFSTYQIQNFVFGAGVPASNLPAVCRWFATFSTWLLLLPPAILLVATRRLLRSPNQSPVVELLIQLTVLLTVVLVLGCILAWQMPYAIPVVEII